MLFIFFLVIHISFYLLSPASLVVISAVNLALLSTNITKSTSVPSVASALISSQCVV